MAKVQVHPVKSRKELRRFVGFPYGHYKDCDQWVPTLRMEIYKRLNPKKNPFFEHGDIQPFIAVDDKGKVVGTIAAIKNGMHLKKYDDGLGFFGFFECIEDYDVAKTLLDAAAGWVTSQGLTAMRGPVNPSMNDVAGLLVDGFQYRPSILMPYNFSWYETFLTQYGFEREMTMWSVYIHQKYATLNRLERGVKMLKRRNPDVTVRKLNMDNFLGEAKTILEIYNDAWSENWGHVPMTDHEFEHLAKDLKQVVDPNLVFLVEEHGETIGFSITLPDVNQLFHSVRDGRLFPFGLAKILGREKIAGINECRTLLMGIRKKHMKRGLDAFLHHAIGVSGPKHGYVGSEMSWILESNQPMMNVALNIGGTKDKEYAMFKKVL